MTPSEREWGSVTARLDQTIHTLRNLRMIVDEAGNDLSRLAAEVARLRIILATALSVLLLVVGALAWVVELLVP